MRRSVGSACLAVGVAAVASLACGDGQRGDAALADRYERGDGVPRDYRRAAELLARSCADGRGVAAACRRLAIARTQGRGVAQGLDVIALLTLACERGDWLACGLPIPFDPDDARAACARGRHDACLAVAGLSAWSQSGTAQEERRRYFLEACRAGILEGCHYLSGPGAGSEEESQFVRAKLTTACRRGDADACAAIDTPLPDRALCDAGDYQACGRLGAAGDAAALELACQYQVRDACERIALAAIDADPPDPRAAEHVARACRLGSGTACSYDRPDQIATGCVTYQPRAIAAGRRRKAAPLRGTDAAGQAWQAPAGPILLLAELDDIPWANYDEVARRLDIPVVVSLQNDVRRPPLQRATAVTLDPSFRDEPLMTPGPDELFSRVANVSAVFDRDNVIRAFLVTGPRVPATYARCIRHLLERP